MTRRIAVICAFSLLFALSAQHVCAAEQEGAAGKPWERFSITLGYFFTDMSSNVKIGSETFGVGADINMEDALGLDSTIAVFRSDLLWRFTGNRRHRIDFSYFDLSRDSTRTLQRDIEFNDKIYSAGFTVESEFDLAFYNLAYTYSFFQDDRFDIGASLGFHVTDIKLRLVSPDQGLYEEEAVTAPLPVLGIRGNFALTRKLFLKESIEFFYLEYDSFRGLLTDVNLALEYNVWKHVGFGIGYNSLHVEIESDGEDYPTIDFNGKVEYDYSGFQVYAKIYF
jgi:hypothetical protein